MNFRTAVLCPAACVAALAVTTSASAGAIVAFTGDGGLDSGQNPGGVEDRADTTLAGVVGSQSAAFTDTVTGLSTVITTVDIIGANGTSAAAGTGTDNFHETNVNNALQLGINTDTDEDDGLTADAGNFNPGEAWVFSFSSDVELNSFEFANFDPEGGAVVELQFSDGTPSVTLAATIAAEATTAVTQDLGGLFVAEGTEVTFAFVSTGTEQAFSIQSFAINVVPEPASLALLGLGGLAIGARRKRA